MKKIIAFILLLTAFTAVFSGCGNSSQADNKAAQSSKKTINEILAESQAQAATEAPSADYPELDYNAEVDLTVLGSNLVYSTVNGMMTTPDDYLGKTVKASGTFEVYTDPSTGKYYYACIIADATACCAQGLEFVWKGDHRYPADYPDVGSEITIGGVFETYNEGDALYCRLKDAEIAA